MTFASSVTPPSDPSFRPRAPWLETCPEAGVIALAVADVRAEPDARTELVSQLLFGETVETSELTSDGRWLRVRGDDGYAGWMRAWALAVGSLAAARQWRGLATWRVARPWLWRREGGGPLPYGARLAANPLVPSGFVGPLGPLDLAPGDARSIRPATAIEPGRRARALAVLRVARMFLGVPYLWGGRSPAGLDCSALVQWAYAGAGIALPRDARDQCDALGGRAGLKPAAGRSRPRAGDLLFFASADRPVSHVAIATGSSTLIHAYGQVEAGSLDASAVNYVSELGRTWVGFARAPLSGVPAKPGLPA